MGWRIGWEMWGSEECRGFALLREGEGEGYGAGLDRMGSDQACLRLRAYLWSWTRIDYATCTARQENRLVAT